MEYFLFIAAIWVILALVDRWSKKRGRNARYGERRQNAKPSHEGRREPPKPQRRSLEDHRERVIAALREGRLDSGQVSRVLESKSLYNFSFEEVEELRKALALANVPRRSSGPQGCRVCGGPCLPGEDLCYSHQAK